MFILFGAKTNTNCLLKHLKIQKASIAKKIKEINSLFLEQRTVVLTAANPEM